jgi:hypothetical protein
MNTCKTGKKKALLWCVLQCDVTSGVLFGKSCNTGGKEIASAHEQIYDALSVLPSRQMNSHKDHT